MQRVSGGYTIVEVMIVLAISIILVGISMTFLSGRDGHTRFSQNMRSVQSKVQSWLDDVPNGFTFASAGSANCHLGGGSVKIDNGPQNPNGECIFLGKAIQFVDDPVTTVYAYSVFGQRTSGGNLVATIRGAQPVPADGPGNSTGTATYTEAYNLGDGTSVKSIITSSGVTSAGVNSHMAGFYLSLNTDQVIGKNGESNLRAYQYPLGNTTGSSASVVNCLENKAPCALGALMNEPAPLTDWEVCFKNDSNADTAILTIRSSGGYGVTTELEFKSC